MPEFEMDFSKTSVQEIITEYQRIQKFLAETPELQKMREATREKMSPTPRTAMYSENSVTVYRYDRDTPAEHARPLLIVPSLVNKPCIMDLLKGESFIEAMLERGFDVYMIEWGIPNAGQKDLTLQYYLEHYLGRAVRRVAKKAGSDGVSLSGYCLGGTLALLYAALDKGERVKALVNMVSPVNFVDGGLLSWWAREEHFNVDKIVENFGNVPADFFSQSFPWLLPTAKLKNLRVVYDKHKDHEFMTSFLALDIWITENVDFPGQVYRELIKGGYQKNCLVEEGSWQLDDKVVRMEDVKIPVLSLAAVYDHVAPVASCSKLAELVGSEDVSCQDHPTSHLGFALGKDVMGQSTPAYWDLVSGWLAERDG